LKGHKKWGTTKEHRKHTRRNQKTKIKFHRTAVPENQEKNSLYLIIFSSTHG
jgi:hypothetical protein